MSPSSNKISSSNNTSKWFSCYHPRPEAKLRLIGFPHGGGGPQAFREWGQLLPDDIELFALSLPGRGSRLHEPLITSMDKLVPQVIEGLSGYFDKPFLFFGHSVGALVAFEVTRQMQEGGYPLPLHLFVSAHKAPYLAPDEPLMYKYSDGELLSFISELGMVPEEVLNHPELLGLILPPLKADFELSETYRWHQISPVSVPLTGLGGRYDELATAEDLERWAASTTKTFELAMFDGGHFYTQSHQAEVVEFIAQSVERTVSSLPKSIMRGERLPYPQKCLHELLREQAAKTPEAIALVSEDIQLTFRELDEQSDLLASYLQSMGVRVNSLVGVYMETSVEYVIAFFAALKAGGAYMTVEIAYPEALLQQVLNSAQPVVLLTKERFYARLSEEWQPCAFKMEEGWVEQLASDPFIVPHNLPLPTIDSLAQCVMSSGTTGTPKGIICPHRSAVNSYYWRYLYHPYQAGEREACNVFLVWEVARPILQGYPAYIIPDEIIYDPPRLVDYLSKHRITRILFTPSLLEQILNTPHLDLPHKLRHLRVLYLNGEVVTTVLRNRFRDILPEVVLLNDYSTAEAHDTTHFDLKELNPIHSPKYSPIGGPMSNVNLYVLDENQKPVPQGFRGEIYVGGESMGHGYLNQPEKTAQRFPRDPFVNDGSLMFRSGDAGRILPNGQLEIQGRIAFMVKLRGYTVVPSAVETTIIQHPAINTAVVMTQNNEETGQPEHLVAYIVGHGQLDDDMLRDDLRAYLKQNLPYYAIPSYIIPLDELPIAANGKLDRKRLPKPDQAILRTRSRMRGAPPESQAEKALAEVWKSVLHVESVEVTDNFFDLGGHSLLAAELCSQLRETLDLDLSVVTLFQYPTLRDLAQSVSAEYSREVSTDRTMTVDDLQREVILDPAIIPPAPLDGMTGVPNAIFLTGATGFLGAFLLDELLRQTQAQIYCLVRNCNTLPEARGRIQKNLVRYQLDDLLNREEVSERIVPVLGDLSSPLLGIQADEFNRLAREIDVIYHLAADVNLLYPYSALKATNVQAVEEILRLASQSKTKHLHYISTTGVFDAQGYVEAARKPVVEQINEQDSLERCQIVYGGYAQSKWVAEQLLKVAQSRGIPIAVYRPGEITGDCQNGAWNTDSALCRLFKQFILHGYAPELDVKVDMVPVDYVSQAIVYLSTRSESLGTTFHLTNPQPPQFNQLIKEMNYAGYSIKQIEYSDWLSKINEMPLDSEENALGVVSGMFTEKIPNTELTYLEAGSLVKSFDCANTLSGLSGSGIRCPEVERELFVKYLEYFIRTDFIPQGNAAVIFTFVMEEK